MEFTGQWFADIILMGGIVVLIIKDIVKGKIKMKTNLIESITKQNDILLKEVLNIKDNMATKQDIANLSVRIENVECVVFKKKGKKNVK